MATDRDAGKTYWRESSGSDAVADVSTDENSMETKCLQCDELSSKNRTVSTGDNVGGRRQACWKCTRKETSLGGSNELESHKKTEGRPTDKESVAQRRTEDEAKPRAQSSMATVRDSFNNENETRQRYSNNVKVKRSLSFKSSIGRTNAPESVTNSDIITEICERHVGKVMEYYCKTHQELLCSVCMTLSHIECTTQKCVEYIPNIVNTADVENNLKDTIRQIGELAKLCGVQKDATTKRLSKIIEMFNAVNEEIADFRKRVNERIDELERTVLKETQRLRDKMTHDFTRKCEQFDITIKSLRNLTFELHKSQESHNTAKGFVVIRKAEKEIRKQKRDSGIDREEEPLDEYYFDTNEKIETMLKSVERFGSLRKRQRLKSMEIKHNGVLNVQSKDDKKDSWVTGMAILSESRIIVADCDNQMAKLIDAEKNIILTTLRIPSRLHDVTSLPGNHCAITLPYREKILHISVSSDELCVERSVKVDGKCYGIAGARDDKHLMVTFLEPARLQIIQYDGTVIRELVRDDMGKPLFSCPEYVAVSEDGRRVYVSDYDRDTVTVLSKDGNVLNVFKEQEGDDKRLEGPKSVYASVDGYVYVCGSDSNNVLMLTGDCSQHNAALTHAHRIQHPVCFGEVRHADSTVVFLSGGSNTLRVFKY